MPIQKVLVVDDSKTELMYLTDLLQKNGMSVKTAENAEDAFRRLAEEKPDLILMDVVMPGQNGFQLTRAITRDPKDPRVIVYTRDVVFDLDRIPVAKYAQWRAWLSRTDSLLHRSVRFVPGGAK